MPESAGHEAWQLQKSRAVHLLQKRLGTEFAVDGPTQALGIE